ncbi:MAG: class I mannose-6-phosphate isomerase [Synergistaceae bacterium]|nr:class I mannose-6-phosphate isomerase [Synergistaceae bacterium]
MLPFRLSPAYKNYLWGGTRLLEEWAKTSGTETLAESWELASHPDGDSVVLDGEMKGLTLSEAVRQHPAIVSPAFTPHDTFPLMVKLIDAQKPLSVQVHPFNDYARRVENSKGKTEAWYILDHDDGAYIYLGFRKSVSRWEFEQAIINGTATDLLRKVYVKTGDLYFIPAGTIHAIGAGILLAEIQENSNITYRVYDYGRLGADGKPRELHIAKALDVTNTFPLNIIPPGRNGNVIVDCNKFRVEKVRAPYEGRAGGRFRFVLCIDGVGEFACGGFACGLRKGGNIYVPGDCEESFRLEGDCVCLITKTPLL